MNYRCRKSIDCAGFIIDYAATSCHRVPNMGYSTDDIVMTSNVNFFRKACLRGQYDGTNAPETGTGPKVNGLT